jgi:hypothetical protein
VQVPKIRKAATVTNESPSVGRMEGSSEGSSEGRREGSSDGNTPGALVALDDLDALDDLFDLDDLLALVDLDDLLALVALALSILDDSSLSIPFRKLEAMT